MNALIYTIHLLEPLLANQTQVGEPNSAVSLDFVPGSMVRGAVIAGWRQGATSEEGAALHDLFFSGRVRFLNAYPQGATAGSRMLPRPLSWFVEKDDVGEPACDIHDSALSSVVLRQPKAPAGAFVWQGAEHVELGGVTQVAAVHIAGDDRNRKAEGASQVFRHEAIAAGQVLVGVIVAQDEGDLEALAPVLAAVNRLGGARTAGYGRVAVTVAPRQRDWAEYTEGTAPDDKVVVTLLSDAILRGADGQTGAGLPEALGLPPPLAAFQHLRLVGGFNRTWGLPLAQAWAVAAGSVYVFARTPELLKTLRPLQASGVGERTLEGYGRLAIDWQGSAVRTQRKLDRPVAAPEAPVALTPASRALAATMARRQLEGQLQRSLTTQIRDRMQKLKKVSHLPSPAQLSRARLAARRASDAADLQIVVQHFEGLKSAAAQWGEGSVGGEALRDWILAQTRLTRAEFLAQFGLRYQLTEAQRAVAGVAEERTPVVAGIQAEVTAAVQARAIARLIEGVLAQAVKQAKDEERRREGREHR